MRVQEHYSGEEAGLDILSGVLGGAVGGGSGELAGRQAMRLSVSRGVSEVAAERIQLCTNGMISGAVGSFTSNASMAAITNEPVFTSDTALSIFAGAATGFAGGWLPSKAYYNFITRQKLPITATEPDIDYVAGTDEGARITKPYAWKGRQSHEQAQNQPQQRTDRHSAVRLQITEGKDSFQSIPAHGCYDPYFYEVARGSDQGV